MLQLPLCSDKRMLLLRYKDVFLSVNSTLPHKSIHYQTIMTSKLGNFVQCWFAYLFYSILQFVRSTSNYLFLPLDQHLQHFYSGSLQSYTPPY